MADIQLPCATCGQLLRVPDDIDHFACAHCGCNLVVRRTGGIVAFVPVIDRSDVRPEINACREAYGDAMEQLYVEIRDVRVEYEKLMQERLLDVPYYVLLKFEFRRIGKLDVFSAAFANETSLERLFRSLSLNELSKILDVYRNNPDGPTYTWLDQICTLRQQLQELEEALAKMKRETGGSPASA